MKVLIVGGGGREHAIAHSLSKSEKVTELFCAPGNAGIGGVARCVPIGVMEFDSLINFTEENKIDFTVVGMDEPLVAGIVDEFEKRGHKIFGPVKDAAILEGSKSFSKGLMRKYGIPTAEYECFYNYEKALEYVQSCKMPVVIKADGLALGKGVIICNTVEEAKKAIEIQMVDKKFGDAGNIIVIEEFLTGVEISLLAFCDGKIVVPMVTAQDYKRALDNDLGENTGGMGAISPSPVATEEMLAEIHETICVPTLNAMYAEGRTFKGIIYFGLMVTDSGVKVIEYNARFGDPETQVILPKLKTDLLDILLACESGSLEGVSIEWSDEAACCVVLASKGYPGKYQAGYPIEGIADAEKTALVFHAGTKNRDGEIITSGGRVLGVTALGESLEQARELAYNAAEKIKFENKISRSDIGIARGRNR